MPKALRAAWAAVSAVGVQAKLGVMAHISLVIEHHGDGPEAVGASTDVAKRSGVGIAVHDVDCAVGGHGHGWGAASVGAKSAHPSPRTSGIRVHRGVGRDAVYEGDLRSLSRGILDVEKITEIGLINGEHGRVAHQGHAGLGAGPGEVEA